MAKNGRKWVAAVFWSKMDSRAFCTMVIEVARKTMAEMAENGRKWWKKGHRGYLVGNGFPRISRHSPTTKGYRNGRGIKYGKKGEIMFDGFYKGGKRNPKIQRNREHRKYWNEIGGSGQISCICKKNYRGLNDGTCYFYENGNIKSISKWEDGQEIEIINKFYGNQMTAFRNGEIVYSGKYVKLTDVKYIPTLGMRIGNYFMYRFFCSMLWLSRL